MIASIINSINLLFSHVTSPLDLIVALIVVIIIGGLGLILAMLLVWLVSTIWFLPICYIYHKLDS